MGCRGSPGRPWSVFSAVHPTSAHTHLWFLHSHLLSFKLSAPLANENSAQGACAKWIKVPFSPVHRFTILWALKGSFYLDVEKQKTNLFLHHIPNLVWMMIRMIEESNNHSWYPLFPEYLVNVFREGTRSVTDAHLMRPSIVARAEKNLQREGLAHVQTIIINIKQGEEESDQFALIWTLKIHYHSGRVWSEKGLKTNSCNILGSISGIGYDSDFLVCV